MDNDYGFHSIEAETAIIGCVMLDNESIDDVQDIVSSTDFADDFCRKLYEGCVSLRKSGSPIDFVTLSAHLSLEGDDVANLATIVQDTFSRNISTYGHVVRTKALERNLVATGRRISILPLDKSMDIQQKLDLAQSMLTQLEYKDDNNFESVMDIVSRVVDDLEYRVEHKGEVIGLPTGFTAIDKRFCGFNPGDLVIVAGRPSMGKSAWLQSIIQHNITNDRSCLLFSLEMSKEQVVQRMMASLGGVHIGNIMNGDIDPHDFALLGNSIQQLQKSKLFIDDNSSVSINALKSKARKVWKKSGLDLIAVDYLQLMSGEGKNREQEIAGISRELKKLGRELGVPVIALSQLNRSVEERTDKRPLMKDLRESGAIEQDADIILFMYRDEVYNDHSKAKGILEVICRKFRNGEIGTDYLRSDLARMRFHDTDYEPEDRGYDKPKRRGFSI